VTAAELAVMPAPVVVFGAGGHCPQQKSTQMPPGTAKEATAGAG